MNRLLQAILFASLVVFPSVSYAQCTGQFPAYTLCGNGTGSKDLPKPTPIPPFVFQPIAGGTVVGNPTTANALPIATPNPILGIPGTTAGSLGFSGASGGLVSLLTQPNAGTYNFNLPTSSGTSGQPLLSGGGGASPMTFGTLGASFGGTGQTTYSVGDTLYASGTNTLSKLPGNTTTGIRYLSSTGTGSAANAPAWVTISGGDVTGAALTAANDTNVTLTLGGSPATSLLRATSLTMGWTGVLAASRLNANVVQAVTNDTNVTGSIAAQNLTLGWAGTLSVTRGGTSLASLTANNVIVGNGTSAPILVPPSSAPGCLTSTGTSSAPTFGYSPSAQCGPVSYVNRLTELKALPVPTSPYTTLVNMTGYYNQNDGGGGWFYWAPSGIGTDDACTIIQPASAPPTGRWIRILPAGSSQYNVKWCGAKGDGSTNDTAAITTATALAVAVKGTLYFPAVPISYVGQISADSVKGLTIAGDSAGANSIGTNGGSTLSAPSNTIAVNIFSNNFSGDLQDIHIHDLRILVGGTGTALRIYNGLGIVLDNVEAAGFGGNATGCVIHGTAFFTMTNLKCYGAPGIIIGNDNGNSANTGPGTFLAGQYANQAGSNNQPAIVIQGSPLAINFNAIDYGAGGSTCSITIDGPSTPDPGSISGSLGSINFYDIHGESNYATTASTGADVCVGQTYTAGHIGFYGGNAWGSSSSFPTGYHNYWMQVFAAQDVVVDGLTVSNLGHGYGFTGGVIRTEGTFNGSYNFRNITKNDVTILYSSASGKLINSGTNDTVNASNGWTDLAGPLYLPGSSSGAVTINTQANAGTYNFNLPTTAGTSGNCLLSGGGGTNPQTYGPCYPQAAWTSYSPTTTTQGGTGTVFGTTNGAYQQFGKTVVFEIDGSVTTGGSGTGCIKATLPVTLASAFKGAVSGTTSAGKMLNGIVNFSQFGSVVCLLNYDGTTPIATGLVFSASGVFQAQ